MLAQESYKARSADAPSLSPSEAKSLLVQLPEWALSDKDGVPCLVRHYPFKNFVEAMAFANAIATLAESLDHHPELTISWGRVSLSWWTHELEGLHRNDFICAAKSDLLYR